MTDIRPDPEEFEHIAGKPLSYYYGNLWILGPILGKKSKTLFRAWLRFCAVLAAWILLLGFLSAYFGIERTVQSELGDYKIVGYFNDGVMVAFCLWLLAGVAVLLVSMRKFDGALIATYRMIRVPEDEDKEKFRGKLLSEIKEHREYVSLRTKKSRWHYLSFLLFGVGLVLAGNTTTPWFDTSAQSWAIAPRDFFWMWFLSNFWAFFYIVFVFGNMFWFIYCGIRFTLFPVSSRAKKRKVQIPIISDDGKGGVKVISELAFYLMLLPSGGVAVIVGWQLTFGEIGNTVKVFIAIYAVLLALMYFVPLCYLRKAMKESKEAYLQSFQKLLSPAFSDIVAIANSNASHANYFPAVNSGAGPLPLSEVSWLSDIYRRVESMSTNPAGKLLSIASLIVSTSPTIAISNLVTLRLADKDAVFSEISNFFQALF